MENQKQHLHEEHLEGVCPPQLSLRWTLEMTVLGVKLVSYVILCETELDCQERLCRRQMALSLGCGSRDDV